jgi:hypothetical protein
MRRNGDRPACVATRGRFLRCPPVHCRTFPFPQAVAVKGSTAPVTVRKDSARMAPKFPKSTLGKLIEPLED